MTRPWERDEMRTVAETLAAEHDPQQQDHSYAGRCDRCGYTRAPCDTAELAAMVLQLLGEA